MGTDGSPRSRARRLLGQPGERGRRERHAAGSKRASRSASVTCSPARRARATGHPATASAGPVPLAEVGQVTRLALGEAIAVGAEDERDVGPGRAGQPEQVAEQRLAGRRGQQVVAAHDLFDPLVGIVDDDGEVVGEGAVAAAQDDVVGRVDPLAAQAIDDPSPRRRRSEGAARSFPRLGAAADSAAPTRGRFPGSGPRAPHRAGRRPPRGPRGASRSSDRRGPGPSRPSASA